MPILALLLFIYTFGLMITIIEHNGMKLVSSLELYRKVGYSNDHHVRWLRDFISTADKDIDYFDITDKQHQNTFFPRTWQKSHRVKQELYFFTIPFAISACLVAKTQNAKKLKLFLEIHK